MSEKKEGKPNRKVVLALMILPVWLFGSTLVGLWIWTQRHDEIPEPEKFVTEIGSEALAKELSKVLERVGPKHTQSDVGRTGLRRMAAYIEGTLGPDNAGYRIERVLGPVEGEDAWPIILATLPGGDEDPLWVVAAYDQEPSGGGVEANATGVVSVMAAAQALGRETPDRPVVFAFLPHGYDAESPWQPMLELLKRRADAMDRLLVVEGMGGATPKLLASSRSAEALRHSAIDQQTEVLGGEAICLVDDTDLSSLLFEAGFPAVRISTRPVVRAGDGDRKMPLPGDHALSTQRLADLIRSLAGGEG